MARATKKPAPKAEARTTRAKAIAMLLEQAWLDPAPRKLVESRA